MSETCRGCDGKGSTRKADKDNVFKIIEKTCSRCNGSRVEPGPSKGGKRRFGSRQKMDDEEMTHEEMVRAFLAKHGQ
jgi:DnaJ-class molecular chaperone